MAVPVMEFTSTEDKLKFIFNNYDTDGNGQIDRTELQESLRSQIQSTGIYITEAKLRHLTSSLFDQADGDQDGSICFDEFKAELKKYPEVVDTLTRRASTNRQPKSSTSGRKPYRSVTNNIQVVIFLAIYLMCNVVFFTRIAYYHYSIGGNGFYIVARACGHCLNFNGILVLVLMLRKTLSFLRATPIYYIFPFDHTVVLHKFIGLVVALLGLAHTIAHVGNGVTVANASNFTALEFLLTDPSLTSLGLLPGCALITGWLLVVFIAILLLGSMSYVRESGNFEVFNWTHFICYVFIFCLYIMHGPHFWKWFIAPCLIYLLEKLSQSRLVKTFRHGATFIKEARLLPSRVTHLVITRPPRLRYRAGDYMYILIPAIAKYEWHPFTISSAPEEPDIAIHVQSLGTWTKRLYSHFNNLGIRSRTQRIKDKSRARRFEKLTVSLSTLDHDDDAETNGVNTDNHMTFDLKSKQKIRVYIQGPYGTPSTSTFNADHAVLIGGGIGVTPYASIVKSIMHRYRGFQQTCPNCQHTWIRDIPQSVLKIKKVDFVWINRSPTAFEWFVKMLSELEEDQDDSALGHFLDIHLFMTAMRRTDVKSVGLQLALDAAHEQDQRDALTGLRTKLQPGRPDWQTLFTKFKDQRRGKVEVFFCGSHLLGKTVKEYCTKFGFRFHREVF